MECDRKELGNLVTDEIASSQKLLAMTLGTLLNEGGVGKN
jgi:hypothetical protein